jgi:2-dehydropantoate 2-reductase
MAETVGVIGAGALGTLLATRLARAGHTVRVAVRTESRRDSLRREAHGIAAIESDPTVLRGATLLFLCVKAHDTAEAAAGIAPVLSGIAPGPGLCSLQNGWDHMATLASILPETPLVAGATALGAYFDSGGALHASVEGPTSIAAWDGTERRWAEYATTVLESAGIRADVHDDAKAILWRKLCLNAAVNPLTALLDCPNGALLERPALLRIARAATAEAARAGTSLGRLPLGFDPARLLDGLLHDTRSNRSSMAEDLARGRRTEADAIVGAAVRAGREAGKPTPVLDALLALMTTAEARSR